MALFVPENPINSISSPTPKGVGPSGDKVVVAGTVSAVVVASVNIFEDVAFVVKILSVSLSILI